MFAAYTKHISTFLVFFFLSEFEFSNKNDRNNNLKVELISPFICPLSYVWLAQEVEVLKRVPTQAKFVMFLYIFFLLWCDVMGIQETDERKTEPKKYPTFISLFICVSIPTSFHSFVVTSHLRFSKMYECDHFYSNHVWSSSYAKRPQYLPRKMNTSWMCVE